MLLHTNTTTKSANSIILHAPAYDPQIDDPIQQKRNQERRRFRRQLKIVHGPKAALATKRLYQPFIETKLIYNIENSITIASPFIIPLYSSNSFVCQ